MKKLIPKLSMIVPLSLLPALLLTVTFSSCSKPNLGHIVREHIEAVNTDNVERNLTLFTDDAVYEIAVPKFSGKFSGKAELRNQMEWDVVNNARLTINDMKVEGNTVIVELIEKNEGWRLLGIEQPPFTAAYKFRGRQLENVKLEFSPENAELLDEKFRPFAEWARKEHPQEFSKMAAAGYSAEGAKFYLSLAKEWRDKASTERLSVQQELIKLENEWADALVKRDWTFLDRIYADDYMWTGANGEVATKAQEIAFLKSGEHVFTSWVLAEMKVRVYGDAAVVTGRNAIKETHKGEDVSSRNRWTHTWVKRAGRWQCVAAHRSKIAQK